MLERGFNSCRIPGGTAAGPGAGGAGKCAAGKFGAAGGKAAQLSVLPLWAEPALKPHSPGPDKSYRKRGDLSLGLAWFVSARQRAASRSASGCRRGSRGWGHLISSAR